jgi:hypothetical protein
MRRPRAGPKKNLDKNASGWLIEIRRMAERTSGGVQYRLVQKYGTEELIVTERTSFDQEIH